MFFFVNFEQFPSGDLNWSIVRQSVYSFRRNSETETQRPFFICVGPPPPLCTILRCLQKEVKDRRWDLAHFYTFANVCRYLQIFADICKYSMIFANISRYLQMFVNICGCLQILVEGGRIGIGTWTTPLIAEQ